MGSGARCAVNLIGPRREVKLTSLGATVPGSGFFLTLFFWLDRRLDRLLDRFWFRVRGFLTPAPRTGRDLFDLWLIYDLYLRCFTTAPREFGLWWYVYLFHFIRINITFLNLRVAGKPD